MFWCCCEDVGGITNIIPDVFYFGESLKDPASTGTWRHGYWATRDVNNRTTAYASLSPSGLQQLGVFESGPFVRRYGAWCAWAIKINRTAITSSIVTFNVDADFITSVVNRTTRPRVSPPVQAAFYTITNRRIAITSLMPLTDGSAPHTPTNPIYTYSSPVNATMNVTAGLQSVDITAIVQAAMSQPGWTAGDYVTIVALPRVEDFLSIPHTPDTGTWAWNNPTSGDPGIVFQVS